MREDLRLMKACQAVFWLAAPPLRHVSQRIMSEL
ncbi:hypothetical protein EL75_4901 [Escherichia coli]|nr:hypothetical protein EL75_4901 [Escherichia coli]